MQRTDRPTTNRQSDSSIPLSNFEVKLDHVFEFCQVDIDL